MKPKGSTLPEVFIIETLDPDDEGNGRFEGSILSRMLRLHGKNPKYRYVRTRNQFRAAVAQFGRSRYRYLHISCHANSESMRTTNQDDIEFKKLAAILRPHLRNRRLFLSACDMVNDNLARQVLPSTGCYSIIGPDEDVRFTDAAVLWASLYHLMFTRSPSVMKHPELLRVLGDTSKLFSVSMSYFSKSKNRRKGYKRNFLKR